MERVEGLILDQHASGAYPRYSNVSLGRKWQTMGPNCALRPSGASGPSSTPRHRIAAISTFGLATDAFPRRRADPSCPRLADMERSTNQGRHDEVHRLLIVCGGTAAGVAQSDNQDTFIIADLASGRTSRPCIRTDMSVHRPGVLLVVCDGASGMLGGKVAAHVAARAVKNELEQGGSAVLAEPGRALKRALVGANHAVVREAKAHTDETGMETTCTAAVFGPQSLAVAQVGDSRAYLLRDANLARLTRDQTLGTDQLHAGVPVRQDVDSHYSHMLTQALGAHLGVQPVVTAVDLHEGDRILLCSDGLNGALDDDEIASLLRGTGDVAHTAEALISAALEAGSPDNVTVVVAECGRLATQ
jgi:serine/threonine protein phosphatase PrpC